MGMMDLPPMERDMWKVAMGLAGFQEMISGRMGSEVPQLGRHILVHVQRRVYSGPAVAELLRLLLERHLSHGNCTST